MLYNCFWGGWQYTVIYVNGCTEDTADRLTSLNKTCLAETTSESYLIVSCAANCCNWWKDKACIQFHSPNPTPLTVMEHHKLHISIMVQRMTASELADSDDYPNITLQQLCKALDQSFSVHFSLTSALVLKLPVGSSVNSICLLKCTLQKPMVYMLVPWIRPVNSSLITSLLVGGYYWNGCNVFNVRSLYPLSHASSMTIRKWSWTTSKANLNYMLYKYLWRW